MNDHQTQTRLNTRERVRRHRARLRQLHQHDFSYRLAHHPYLPHNQTEYDPQHYRQLNFSYPSPHQPQPPYHTSEYNPQQQSNHSNYNQHNFDSSHIPYNFDHSHSLYNFHYSHHHVQPQPAPTHHFGSNHPHPDPSIINPYRASQQPSNHLPNHLQYPPFAQRDPSVMSITNLINHEELNMNHFSPQHQNYNPEFDQQQFDMNNFLQENHDPVFNQRALTMDDVTGQQQIEHQQEHTIDPFPHQRQIEYWEEPTTNDIPHYQQIHDSPFAGQEELNINNPQQHIEDPALLEEEELNMNYTQQQNDDGANNADVDRTVVIRQARNHHNLRQAWGWVEPFSYSPHKLRPTRFCPHCNAILFQFETSSLCCCNGRLILPQVSPPPDLLCLFKDSTVATSESGQEFITNIRLINSNFAFTSLGINQQTHAALARQDQGVYTFRVTGTIHHKLGTLLPVGDSPPKFLQLYLYDTHNELENRRQWGPHLSRNLMQFIQDILHHCNPYVHQFQRLSSELTPNRSVRLTNNQANLDQRVYNLPTTDQVAAIWIEGMSILFAFFYSEA